MLQLAEKHQEKETRFKAVHVALEKKGRRTSRLREHLQAQSVGKGSLSASSSLSNEQYSQELEQELEEEAADDEMLESQITKLMIPKDTKEEQVKLDTRFGNMTESIVKIERDVQAKLDKEFRKFRLELAKKQARELESLKNETKE